jgi:hypothetical protein
VITAKNKKQKQKNKKTKKNQKQKTKKQKNKKTKKQKNKKKTKKEHAWIGEIPPLEEEPRKQFRK